MLQYLVSYDFLPSRAVSSHTPTHAALTIAVSARSDVNHAHLCCQWVLVELLLLMVLLSRFLRSLCLDVVLEAVVASVIIGVATFICIVSAIIGSAPIRLNRWY